MSTDGLKQRISERLASMNLTANAASTAAGLGRDYVRNIQDDKSRAPMADPLLKLARVLGCRLEWLISGEGPVDREDNGSPTSDERMATGTDVDADLMATVISVALSEVGAAAINKSHDFGHLCVDLYQEFAHERARATREGRAAPDIATVARVAIRIAKLA